MQYRFGHTSRYTHLQMAVAHAEATLICALPTVLKVNLPPENLHRYVK